MTAGTSPSSEGRRSIHSSSGRTIGTAVITYDDMNAFLDLDWEDADPTDKFVVMCDSEDQALALQSHYSIRNDLAVAILWQHKEGSDGAARWWARRLQARESALQWRSLQDPEAQAQTGLHLYDTGPACGRASHLGQAEVREELGSMESENA